jgi:hypothetical protein
MNRADQDSHERARARERESESAGKRKVDETALKQQIITTEDTDKHILNLQQ